MISSADRYIRRARKLKNERAIWEAHWQDVAYYCLPVKANITSTLIPGSLLPADVYDSTAIRDAELFASALYAYLTNPASRWFSLGLANPILNQRSRKWLREQEDIIYQVLANSNFYQPLHEVYSDLVVFGTPVMYEEEDPIDYVRFYSRPISESFLVENEKGIVDTNYRMFKLTAEQALLKWGKAVSEEVKKMAKEDPDKKFDFLHVVSPRYKIDRRKKDARSFPFQSIYIDVKAKKIISEGGYKEFPFFTPRYKKRSDSVYGYSPSMYALPDIKMINTMALTIMNAEEKMVDPPLQGPDDGYILPLDTSPGAINYHRADIRGSDGFRPLYDTRIHNLDAAVGEVEKRKDAIDRAFAVDLFLLMVNRPKMTATEVVQRVDEKMLILSPILGRLMKELLQPIISRTFNILVRRKVIEVPEELVGQKYIIKYVSPLAKAQRAAELRQLEQYLDLIAQLSNVNQEILDNINFDRTASEIAELSDINPIILNSDSEVQEIRTERQLMQAAALEVQQQGGGNNVQAG